jgi:hypothetical protein
MKAQLLTAKGTVLESSEVYSVSEVIRCVTHNPNKRDSHNIGLRLDGFNGVFNANRFRVVSHNFEPQTISKEKLILI